MTKAKVSQQKRSRERAKQEKRQQKAERRSQPNERPKRQPGGEDPDLAGIVPGPQPSPWGEEEEVETFLPQTGSHPHWVRRSTAPQHRANADRPITGRDGGTSDSGQST